MAAWLRHASRTRCFCDYIKGTSSGKRVRNTLVTYRTLVDNVSKETLIHDGHEGSHDFLM